MKILYKIVITIVILQINCFASPKFSYSQDLTPEEIYEIVNDAVVVILTYDFDGNLYKQGSGVVINDKGFIITNYHVYAEGKRIEVRHNDRSIIYTDILCADEDKDVLILKIQNNTFPYVHIGDSKNLKVGQRIYAIGSPLGMENSISEGIISGLRNANVQNKSFIQITASISPGSSGGAVINSKGELIGISTMTLKGGQNLNFAIPINDIMSLPISDYKNKLDVKGNNLFYEGLNALDACNYKDALNSFNEYIKFFPDDEVAFLNLGLSYYYLDSFYEARKCFDKAISLKRDYLDAYFDRALNYHFLREYDKEIADYNQVLILNPNDGDAYRNRGWCKYWFTKDTKGGFEDFYKAIEINPNSYPEIYYRIGLKKYELKEYNESIQCFSKVIELTKEIDGEYGIANAYFRRALSNWNAGNKNEFCKDFEMAKHLGHIIQADLEKVFIQNCK